MASVAEQAEEAAACLERTAEHLSDAVEDFVWLCGAVWPTRLDLKTAFLDGYGCRLSDAERRALPLLTARLAVSYLTSGITKQEPVLIERGRTALTHLAGARG